MADDNVTPIEKASKDPKVAALNKIREASAKEWNTKIEAQVKKTIDAKKIFVNERNALIELMADLEEAKLEFADIIKEL